ncbi:hypothetical protein PAHAL_8G044800 [Panicum hallii]|uniref:Uncharacterized protein n=1 Tax=Panicum hallii TaxID=206008 RepID=A0A2T8I7P6_9POAL|nr:hypothetical protein PAHAL_8G044800 [Panicum hallii]
MAGPFGRCGQLAGGRTRGLRRRSRSSRAVSAATDTGGDRPGSTVRVGRAAGPRCGRGTRWSRTQCAPAFVSAQQQLGRGAAGPREGMRLPAPARRAAVGPHEGLRLPAPARRCAEGPCARRALDRPTRGPRISPTPGALRMASPGSRSGSVGAVVAGDLGLVVAEAWASFLTAFMNN